MCQMCWIPTFQDSPFIKLTRLENLKNWNLRRVSECTYDWKNAGQELASKSPHISLETVKVLNPTEGIFAFESDNGEFCIYPEGKPISSEFPRKKQGDKCYLSLWLLSLKLNFQVISRDYLVTTDSFPWRNAAWPLRKLRHDEHLTPKKKYQDTLEIEL